MNSIIRNIFVFSVVFTMFGLTSAAQTDLVEYFTWTSETNTAQGGEVILTPANIYTTKDVENADNETVTYKVVDLNDVFGASQVTVKLDQPIKKGDVLSLNGFYYFNGATPEGTHAVIEIAGNEYTLDGFNNLYKNSLIPQPRLLTLDKACIGATEITIKATVKTLWLTEISVSHDPNVKTFLSAEPASGSTIAVFREFDSKIKVTTNFKADRDIKMTMTDRNDAEFNLIGYLASEGQAVDGVYTYAYEFDHNEFLYKGHVYDTEFVAYVDDEEVDPYIVQYFGATQPPFSDVTLTKQTPSADATITSANENVVTLDFSSEATVSKVEAVCGDTVEEVPTFEAANEAKTQWTVTVPEKVISDNLAFTLRVYAKDSQGLTIVSEGSKEWVSVAFKCNVPKPLAVTPAGGTEFFELKEFTLSYAGGIDLSGDAALITLTKGEVSYPGTLAKNGEVYVYALSEALTAVGTYTLSVPAKMFRLGIGFDSEALTVDYTIPMSGVKLVTQSPAPDAPITNPSDNVVTLTFGAAVTISKIELAYGETTVQIADFKNKEGDNKVWDVTIPKSVIIESSGFTLKVWAKDQQGRPLGDEAGNEYVTSSFMCHVPKLLTILPSDSDVQEELSEFALSYKGGDLTLIDDKASITLTMQDPLTGENHVYEGTLTEIKSSPKRYKYALDNPLTLGGLYQLRIPAKMFQLGTEFDNDAMVVDYLIRQKEDDVAMTYYRVDGGTEPLNTLSAFLIDFTKSGYVAGYVNDAALSKNPIYIIDSNNDNVAKVKSYEIIDGTASFKCFFNKEILVAGTYFLRIPRGVFWMAKDINNLKYIPNGEMAFEVDVVQSENPADDFGPITITPENGATVHDLTRTVIRFEDAFSVFVADGAEDTFDVFEVKDDEPGDAVKSKAVLKKYHNSNGLNLDGRLNISLCFEPGITQAGTYTTTIPANTLYITYLDGPKLYFDRDWTFTYTVDPNAGIEDIYIPVHPSELDENDLVQVYNLQGILVRQGRLSEAINGLKGLYIVNGYKLFIK